DLVESRPSGNIDRVLAQRLSGELDELLRGAEPGRPPRREDDGGDHRSFTSMPKSLRNQRTIEENNADNPRRTPPTGAACTGVVAGGADAGCVAPASDASVPMAPVSCEVAASIAMFAPRHSANCSVSFAVTSV